MKVLVTGGAGFIGSHLVEALVGRGHRVRVLDNLSTGNLRNLDSVLKKIDFIRGDIRDPRALKKAVSGMEVVFHEAALRSVPESVVRPEEYHEVNATATLRLLQGAVRAKVRRLIYASSSSVYGKTPLPQREITPLAPRSPYAVSKLSGEMYCTMFHRLTGLETVVLRYFNVFGPRQSLDNEYAVVIPRFITSLLQGEAPPIHGDGTQTRDFTYVENVIQANLKAASVSRASGQVFNVACGRTASIRELADRLVRSLGVKISPRHTPPRTGDLPHSWADIGKAKRILGYRVTVPFPEGLARTVAWFDQHREVWNSR